MTLTIRNAERKFGVIGELEEIVRGVFGSLEILSEQEIALLFSFAYLQMDHALERKLKSKQLLCFAKVLIKEANHIYDNQSDRIERKLDDFHIRGMEFQSNSEGPFILAAFCLALQNKMQWSNEELFKYAKKNL